MTDFQEKQMKAQEANAARRPHSCPEPRNRGHADVVRSGEVFQRRALRAALAGFRLLLRGERRGAAHMLAARLGAAPALRRAGADKIALHVGEAAKDGNHQAPGAGGGVGPRLGQGAELPARVHDALDVVADRGNFKIEDIEACEKAGMTPYVPKPQRGSSVRNGFFRKDEFRYDAERDAFICPAGQVLSTRYESKLREL
jgi:hypothetical protein